MGRNIVGSKRGFGWNADKQRLELYVNGSAVEYWDEPKGRTYYVNNITGDDSNDGLSWDNAMDQLSTAVAASEAYRALQDDDNQYVRNTIMIQGTASEYTGALTDLGEFVNIIGLSTSDQLSGMDLGVVRIGSSSTSGAEVALMMRGVNMQNLLFVCGGSSKYGLRVIGNSLSCNFFGCGFQSTGDSVTALMYFDALCANGLIERCQFSPQNGGTKPVSGLYVVGQHSDMRVVDNVFATGSSSCVYLGTGTHSVSTLYYHNFFIPTATCAVGFHDDSAGGYAALVENYFSSTHVTDPIERVVHYRTINNRVSAGTDSLIST